MSAYIKIKGGNYFCFKLNYKFDEFQVWNTSEGAFCGQRSDVKEENNMVGRVKLTYSN
jgi:hypothetical protein